MKFEDPFTEHKWAIRDLNPGLPSDWSAYEYLTMEFKASSSQYFMLNLIDKAGVRSIALIPFQNAWVRASVPLSLFESRKTVGTTMSATYQAGLPCCWTSFYSGPFGPINNIDSIGIMMPRKIGSPEFELRNIKLTMAPEDSLLSPVPVVDEFGQWIPDEWPGKVKSFEELQTEWRDEEASIEKGDFNYSEYGGYLNLKSKATGFFVVTNVVGRWWFVDPEGYLFFSAGSTGIGTRAGLSRIEGREYFFEKLPPNDSYYIWNLEKRFGSDWTQKWIDLTLRRMDAWGLNTIANWSDPAICNSQQKAYVANIDGWGTDPRTMGLPDVYSPEYPAMVDEAAGRQCGPRKNDPYLIGYFIGKEPIWPGREVELTNIILMGEETPMQQALKKFLAGNDTPERRIRFVYETYQKFVAIVNSAIKKYDPNHLNLGLRFAGIAHDEIVKASKDAFDVFSLNVYGYSTGENVFLSPDPVHRVYELSGLPIILTEFHFGAPGRGLAPGLAQVSNQADRGLAYKYYVENAASHPAVIGTHWFQWLDEVSTGRNDGENYNIGFVDVTDRPYAEFIEGVKETHKRIADIHAASYLLQKGDHLFNNTLKEVILFQVN